MTKIYRITRSCHEIIFDWPHKSEEEHKPTHLPSYLQTNTHGASYSGIQLLPTNPSIHHDELTSCLCSALALIAGVCEARPIPVERQALERVYSVGTTSWLKPHDSEALCRYALSVV